MRPYRKIPALVIFVCMFLLTLSLPLFAAQIQSSNAAAASALGISLQNGNYVGNQPQTPVVINDTDTGQGSGTSGMQMQYGSQTTQGQNGTANMLQNQGQNGTANMLQGQQQMQNQSVQAGMTSQDLTALPAASPDKIEMNSLRLDPREIKGSSMFNNLRDDLKRFGMDFFAQRRPDMLMFAPVGPNYIVAPGDEVKVNVWGYSELRANLIVDRDGTLTLPQAGPLQAAGLSFFELKKAIEKAYGRILTDFELSVSMGKLHTITVYVTGQAAHPGAYAVSSMATVVDVLSQAGGPSISGSLRAIELKRGNKKVGSLDVYNLLLRGDRKGDLRLAEGDVIFIPTVGPLVTVAGNVKRPAIYEMTLKETKLQDVIGLAGGLASGAFKGRIQIVRVENNAYRTSFESDLTAPEAKAQKVCDGDLLKIFAVPGDEFSARIDGAVFQPGIYAITPGETTLASLIKRAGGLKYTAAAEGELTRVEVSVNGPVTTRRMVNIKNALKDKIILQRDDYFFVRTVPDWNIYRSASINGRVQYPGNYAVQRGEHLSSLLERAGGYAQGAFIKGAVFLRESIRLDQQKNITDMTNKLEREMLAEGNEAISTAATASDLEYAKSSVAQKSKYLDALRNLKASGRLVVALPDDIAKLKGTPYDIELQEGDKLFIPERPGTVQVIGSVTTQSAFVFRSGLPFTEYVKMAGGYLKTASPKRTYILKADGSTVRAYSGSKPAIIEEGDFVVVPERIVMVPTLRNTMSVIDIIYKMVLGVAAINYIF